MLLLGQNVEMISNDALTMKCDIDDMSPFILLNLIIEDKIKAQFSIAQLC